MSDALKIDTIDRQIINALQGGFPICDEPFKRVASWFGIKADELIRRIDSLQQQGLLSRFGPLYNSERLGGAVTLAALSVPEDRFDEVNDMVNAHRQVAHNYARTHTLNMWFVIATETPQEIDEIIDKIESETGLKVYNCPKEHEYFIGLRLEL